MSTGRETVTITVNADNAQAKAFAAVLAAGFDQAGNAVERMGKKGKTGFTSLLGDADKFILKLVTVQGAADLAMRAVRGALDKSAELRRASVEPTVALDTGVRRYLATQGMPAAKGYMPVKEMFLRAANQYAVPGGDVATIGEAMASANVPHAAVAGGGLDAMMQGWVAMNQVGGTVDPSAHGKAMVMLLSSMGLENTPANLDRVNRALFAAKSKGNVEIAELPQVAGHAGTVRTFGKLNLEEYAASIAMLSRRGGTEEMATSLKNVVLGMTQFGNVPGKVDALAKLKLKPEDVDINRETFFEALAKIQKGLAGLPEAERTKILGQLWGEKTIRAIPGFFEGMGEIGEIQAAMGDKAAFANAVGIGTQGHAAQFRRKELAREQGARAGDFEGQIGYEMRQSALDAGLSRGELSDVPGMQYISWGLQTGIEYLFAGFRDHQEVMKAQIAESERLRAKLGEGLHVEMKQPIEAKSEQPARGREAPGVWDRLKAGFDRLSPKKGWHQ